jgi:LysM repeat protein
MKVRRNFLFSILIFFLLFSGACKSKPAPVNVPPATSTTPPVTQPSETPTNTTNPDTSSGNTIGSSTGNTSSTTGNRHSSGVILDGATNYSVVKGDTLNGIARRFYNDGSYYPLIMMVSTIVVDPDEILPLQRLTVPALNVNMNDPTARQSINRYFLQIADIEDQRGRHGTAALIRNHTR